MKSSQFEITSNRVAQYLSEVDRAQTAKEIAKFLGMTTSSSYGILQLMVVFGKVLKVKRGGRHYYLHQGVYDDEQISAMLPPKKEKRIPKRRRYAYRSLDRSSLPVHKSFLEEHLSSMRTQASPGEGPSALAIIGLDQQETVEKDILVDEKPAGPDIKNDIEEEPIDLPIKSEPWGTITNLPKDMRRLTLGQMKALDEQVKGLDGYERIKRFKTIFAKVSTLKNGRYGTIFYFSMGTNPWDRIYKVTVDDSLSLEPGKKEKKLRGGRGSKYDPIIDQFIENGYDLAEIAVGGRKPSYIASQLRRRIEERGLELFASSLGGSIYLESAR